MTTPAKFSPLLLAALIAGCGGSGYTASSLEKEIRPDLDSQLSAKGITLDDLTCIKNDTGGRCIADISDGATKDKLSINVTKGDDDTAIWDVE